MRPHLMMDAASSVLQPLGYLVGKLPVAASTVAFVPDVRIVRGNI